jgi:hypothetical protein
MTPSQQRADLIAGISGVLLLLAIFLPWFGPSTITVEAFDRADEVTRQAGGEPPQRPDLTESAWQAFSFVRYVLLFTALVGMRAGIAAVARPRGHSAIGATAVTAGLGILSSLLILYRLIDPIGEAGREYGLFVGLLAAIGVAVGGWLSLEEGTGSSRERGGEPREHPLGSPHDG